MTYYVLVNLIMEVFLLLLIKQIRQLFFKILCLILLLRLFHNSRNRLHVLRLIHTQRIKNCLLGSFTLVTHVGLCILFLTLITHVSCILHFLTVTWCDTLILPLWTGHLLREDWHSLVLSRLPHTSRINFRRCLNGTAIEAFLAIENFAAFTILVTTILLI